MAKIISIHPDNPSERQLNQVIQVLREGGIIIFPSDTVYAMGCDITNVKAMKKLAELKGIKLEKARFSIVCNDLSHLSDFTKPIDTSSFRLLKQYLPGAFTFILEAGKGLPAAYKGHKTVGIRVPDHDIPRKLVQMLGAPIASTSIKDDDEIIEYTTDPELIAEKFQHSVEVVIDAGYGGNIASTVVDLTSGEPQVIRQGKGTLDL